MNGNNDLEKEIRALYAVEPSEALRDRLRCIPHEHPRRSKAGRHLAPWFVALPAAAAAGLIGLLWLQSDQSSPEPDPVAMAAVRDFVTAMNYLQSTTAYANRAMQNQLGYELSNAVAMSRESVSALNSELDNGG